MGVRTLHKTGELEKTMSSGSHQQHHQPHAALPPRAQLRRPLPQLQLPTFSLRGEQPLESTPSCAAATPPAARSAYQSRPLMQPVARHAHAQHYSPETATAMAQAFPAIASQPQPAYATPAQTAIRHPQTASPQRYAPAATTAVAWSATEEGFRITPVHMGIALTLIVFAWIISSGPSATLSVPAPAALPAAPIANATLPMKQQPAGLMSPSAAASVQVERGEKPAAPPVPVSDAPIPMEGIPSPAAAAKFDNSVLPMRADDGVTLPDAAGERDSHPINAHYDDTTATLPFQEIERPVATPADAAIMAEQQAATPVVAAGVIDDSAAYSPPNAPNAAF